MPSRKRKISQKTMAAAQRYAKRKRYERSSVSRRINTISKQVKKITKSIEHKSHYVSANSPNMTTLYTGVLDPIGTFGNDEVDGQKITATSHNFNLKCEFNTSNYYCYSKWRVLVVQPQDDVQLVLADVLHNVTQDYVFQSGYKSQNIEDNKKYTVLMDQSFMLNYLRPLKIIKFKKAWKTGKVITLNQQGLVTSSKGTNQYRPQIIYYCQPDANGSTGTAAIHMQAKLRFNDL